MDRSVLRHWFAPLLLLGLAWPQGESRALRPEPVGGDEPVEREAGRPRPITAAELWSQPGQNLGQEVLLTVQIHSHVESWNPFVTRFGTGEYLCLRAWGDEQYLWREADHEHPTVRVFTRRGSAAHWALAEAQRFQRYELTCTVRSVFGGVPWVEVSGVKPLIRQVGDGTVLHASRGVKFFDTRVWVRAKSELERALVAGMPERGREELERMIAVCEAELAKRVILGPRQGDGR